MSISPTVDAEYRIHPSDLEGHARHVVIANVTYQGVEQMTPVLHFEGQTRRLVLSPDQVRQLIEVTSTPFFSTWIGVPVILYPRQDSIDIMAVTPHRRSQPMPVNISEDSRGWRLALLVVGTLVATSGIYVALNLTALVTMIQQLRDNWPLR